MKKTSKTNIFVIEDNELFNLALRTEIESVFQKKNMEVFSFGTGELAKKRFRTIKPQIIILDYHLNSKDPDAANGVKILDWIKKENPATYVVMLTNNDQLDIATESLKHGASDYVVKTETQFKKIIYSLMNVFKLMEANADAKRYKRLVVGLFSCILLLIGGIIAFNAYRQQLALTIFNIG